MSYDFIKLEKQGHIATLTLNRPDKVNALSSGLLAEFSHALDCVHEDHDINVMILTSEGRSFCGGFDISGEQDLSGLPSTAQWDAKHLPARVLMKLWNLRQPTISAVRGYAVAAGNVLAMTADIVIAADDAKFGEPEIRMVMHSPAIVLPFMIPLRHLHWLYYTGDVIDAHTAEKWNMVNKVVPVEDLMDEAWSVAERIAKVPPFAAQMMKRSIKATYDKMGFTEAFEHHLTLRMIESTATGVPEKEVFNTIKQEFGLKAMIEARDEPFE